MAIIDSTGFNWESYISPHVRQGLDAPNGYDLGYELGLVAAETRGNDLSYFTQYANDRSVDASYRVVSDNTAPDQNYNPITPLVIMNGLAYQIKNLMGTANWFTTPPATLTGIVAALNMKAAIADKVVAQWNADKIQSTPIHTAAPTSNQVLAYNSTNLRSEWKSLTASDIDSSFETRVRAASRATNRKKSFSMTEHFFWGLNGIITGGNIGILGLTVGITGTSVGAQTANATANNPGAISLTTGTTATGRVNLRGNTAGILFDIASGSWTIEQTVRLPVLSNGTEAFMVWAGFGDSSTSTIHVDGVYFYYDQTFTTWQCVCRSNNVQTIVSSSVTVATNVFQSLKIIVTNNTQALFYIDDVLVATITTNIPSGSGRETGISIAIVKTVGITPRLLDLDFLEVAAVLP
jgi:hypothetical protein